MEKPPVVHHTFHLERQFPCPVERVFDAFADPEKKRSWYGDRDTHEVEEFVNDFRVGGVERLRYRFREGTLFPGLTILNEGAYQDITPGERIVIASTMSFQDRRISVSLLTFEFFPREGGTTLTCTHQGVFFEGSGGPQLREAGWVALLDSLKADLAA